MTTTKEAEFSFGTFNTWNQQGKVTISPAISGYLGDYYFENRYNYEAANSASINVGKRIFRKLKHVEMIPMAGLVFGSFKGITAELQTSLDYPAWSFSTDNQFSLEYIQPGNSLYFNWNVARYKLTSFFRIGLTSFIESQANGYMEFDKGLTAVILFNKWSLRFYAFNFEREKRFYWLGVRYNFSAKIYGN
jgi:hypothetical protein